MNLVEVHYALLHTKSNSKLKGLLIQTGDFQRFSLYKSFFKVFCLKIYFSPCDQDVQWTGTFNEKHPRNIPVNFNQSWRSSSHKKIWTEAWNEFKFYFRLGLLELFQGEFVSRLFIDKSLTRDQLIFKVAFIYTCWWPFFYTTDRDLGIRNSTCVFYPLSMFCLICLEWIMLNVKHFKISYKTK